jgi:hypothetical protein
MKNIGRKAQTPSIIQRIKQDSEKLLDPPKKLLKNL